MQNKSRGNLKGIGVALALCVGCIALASCNNVHKLTREHIEPEALLSVTPADSFLKAHLNGGHLVLFDSWALDTVDREVRGSGVELDYNRDTVGTGVMAVHLDSVAIFETNVVQRSPTMATLGVLTGITAAVAVLCATSPKTCFGSCPTFYVPEGDSLSLRAEGFSSSIAPSLEKSDVDRLEPVGILGDTLTITMTNEALETHVVRHADLLAVPKMITDEQSPQDIRIFQGHAGDFYQAMSMQAPVSCDAPEGDCLELMATYDGNERSSLADSTSLASKEWIKLQFDELPAGDAGLVLGMRQSLMSTFLLYQALAYMGEDVGHWIAQLERSGLQEADPMHHLLKEVAELEVYIEQNGERVKVGGISEYGPLVTDEHIIRLPALEDESLNVWLHLNKGFWRLDYIALAGISEALPHVRIQPVATSYKGTPDAEALENLLDPSSSLVTLPGDRYEISYELGAQPERYAYFLESRGYYLEWIRQEWLADQDPAKVRQMFLNPSATMKELAPAFKAIEPVMEEAFWNSRFATN